MDFTLSDEQRQFQQSVRTFARRELAEKALSRAHDPAYPWDVAHALATHGLLGLTIPAEDGGGGGTLLDAVIAIQELALVCPTSADVFQAGNFGAIRTVQEYATPDQKHRFLPDLLAGRGLVVVGMSESEAGSAVTDLRTTATVDGSDVVISGTKLWSTYSYGSCRS